MIINESQASPDHYGITNALLKTYSDQKQHQSSIEESPTSGDHMKTCYQSETYNQETPVLASEKLKEKSAQKDPKTDDHSPAEKQRPTNDQL